MNSICLNESKAQKSSAFVAPFLVFAMFSFKKKHFEFDLREETTSVCVTSFVVCAHSFHLQNVDF